MSSSEEQKLPLSSLTAMVIGSMVGAGIFQPSGPVRDGDRPLRRPHRTGDRGHARQLRAAPNK